MTCGCTSNYRSTNRALNYGVSEDYPNIIKHGTKKQLIDLVAKLTGGVYGSDLNSWTKEELKQVALGYLN
jgi:hypothetical protein